MSASGGMNEPMKRVLSGETHISLQMTHEQYGSICAALLLIQFDHTLSPELIAEYRTMRELLISSPVEVTE